MGRNLLKSKPEKEMHYLNDAVQLYCTYRGDGGQRTPIKSLISRRGGEEKRRSIRSSFSQFISFSSSSLCFRWWSLCNNNKSDSWAGPSAHLPSPILTSTTVDWSPGFLCWIINSRKINNSFQKPLRRLDSSASTYIKNRFWLWPEPGLRLRLASFVQTIKIPLAIYISCPEIRDEQDSGGRYKDDDHADAAESREWFNP